jgi:hypothetical protein
VLLAQTEHSLQDFVVLVRNHYFDLSLEELLLALLLVVQQAFL